MSKKKEPKIPSNIKPYSLMLVGPFFDIHSIFSFLLNATLSTPIEFLANLEKDEEFHETKLY